MKKIETEGINSDYFDGKKNRTIRLYYYMKNGLSLINEFRYLMMGIFATYFALGLKNPVMILVMFCITAPILIFLGWLNVHHIEKVMEYLNIRFTTVWSRYNYDLSEKRNDLLKAIYEHITKKKTGEKNDNNNTKQNKIT